MIENEVQLKNAFDKVSELLQDIQTYIEKQGAHPRQGLRNGIVSFPRGFFERRRRGGLISVLFRTSSCSPIWPTP